MTAVDAKAHQVAVVGTEAHQVAVVGANAHQVVAYQVVADDAA